MEQDVQLLTWNDCSMQGCESTHSPRGNEGPLYAGLGDGTWTTHPEGAW